MPVRVIDRSSQSQREVSPAEAQEGLAQGKYALPSSQKVTVGNEYEGFQDVDPSELQQHLAQGSHIADADEARQWQVSREESDVGSMALGALEAGARGATMGLSDPLITAFDDPERVRARQDALGYAGTGIELATGLATMVGTGGAGAVAKGGATLGKQAAARALAKRAAESLALPARGASRLGAMVEGGIARALPEASPQLVKSMVPLAGRGAVEGYAMNVGHSISEAALDDRDLTAEQLLIHDGFLGAALGAGGGAAIPLLGRVISAGARVPFSALKAVAGKVSAGKWDEGLIRAVGRASGDGASADVLASLPRGLRQRVASGDPALVAEVAQAVRTPIKNAVNDAMEAQAALLKSGRVKTRSLGGKDDGVIPRMAMDRVQHAGEQIAGVAAANAESGAYLTKVLKTTLKEHQVARAAVEKGGAANSYQALATYRNRLDGEIESLGGLRALDDAATDVQTRNTLDFLRTARDDIDGFLGDETIFREVGKAHRGVIDATAARQAAGRDVSEMLRKLDDDAVASRYAIEGESIAGLDGLLDSLEASSKHLALPDDVAAKIAKARESRKLVDQAVEANRQAASGIDAMRHLGGQDRTVAKTIGGLAREGALAAGVGYGPAGWAVAKGIEAATNPVGVMKGITAVAAATEVVAKHLDVPIQKIANVMRGAGRAAAPAAVRATAGLTRAQRIERAEAVRDGAAKLANPVDAVDHLKTSLYDLDSLAPNVAQAMRGKVTAAAIFLASKAPAMYRDPFAAPGKPPLVDEASLDRYERYVSAVSDPISVVEHVADGTVTFEEIDALKTVYPSVYKQVAESISNKIFEASADGHELPEQQRISVSLMVGMPFDSSLDPSTLAANQRAIVQGPSPMPSSGAEPAKVRGSLAKSGKSVGKLAAGLELPTDRIASRSTA